MIIPLSMSNHNNSDHIIGLGAVITDICENTKMRHFFWTLLPPPPILTCTFYIQDRYFLDWRMISIHMYAFSTVTCIVSEAKRRAQDITRIATLCAALARQRLRAGRNRRCGRNCDNGSSRCIETWRKCCASRLAHSVPAAHRCFFKKRTWPKPPPPNDVFSFFRKYR